MPSVKLLFLRFAGLNGGLCGIHCQKKMTPEAALQAQIRRYRSMTSEERVRIALGLHEMACEMARVGIRRQHPNATATEVDSLLRKRLELARSK